MIKYSLQPPHLVFTSQHMHPENIWLIDMIRQISTFRRNRGFTLPIAEIILAAI